MQTREGECPISGPSGASPTPPQKICSSVVGYFLFYLQTPVIKLLREKMLTILGIQSHCEHIHFIQKPFYFMFSNPTPNLSYNPANDKTLGTGKSLWESVERACRSCWAKHHPHWAKQPEISILETGQGNVLWVVLCLPPPQIHMLKS